jgi:hypothetical protein
MKYGSKDLMRILDIQKRSDGDIIEAFKLAVRMANEIEIAGKAMSRGYAAIEVYRSKYNPIAALFFDRACQLSGENDIEDIHYMASMNSVGEDESDIESAYASIPIAKQPASRRPAEPKISNIRKGISNLLSLAKINVVKGEGPNFKSQNLKSGTIEVWKKEADRFRIIYTSSPEPTANIGDQREFKIDNDNTIREKWVMVDYIEVYNMMHLMPLYGSSLSGYMYN